MKNANRTYFGAIRLKAKVTDSRRLAVAVAVLFVNAFFVRAQVTDAGVRVNFPFDSAVLNTNYMSNSDALVSLDQIAQEAIASNTTLDVVSYSSPEGNYTYNLRLSEQRAKTISDYLGSKYPGIGLNIVSGAESWDDLRNDVLKDTRLAESSRREILDIIDSNREPDAKEKLLKANSAYKALYSSYFRGLRYANISLRIENSGETAAQHTTTATFSTLHDAASSGMGMPIVYYSLSEDFIRPDYMGNTLNLKEIRRILSDPANRNTKLVLEGSASPEGPVSINERLGIRRAQNLADWLVGQFPDLEGRIVIRSKGEDWEGLRAQVENCSSLDAQAKEEILSIIDSNDTPEKKEEALKAHRSYSIIDTECLPYIRYASFGGFEFVPTEETVVAEEPVVTEEPTLPVIDEPVINEDTTATEISVPQDSLAVDTPKVEQEEKIQKEEEIEKPFIAIGTNGLYDILFTPNVNFEFPLGKHWSIAGEYTFPWFVTPSNKRAWQMLKWDIEPRFWFKGGNKNADKAFTGLFVGLDLSAGYYDIEPYHKGYQGEFQVAGLEAGYCWKLTNNMRFDVAAGFGWMGTHYRYYEGSDDDAHLLYKNHGKIPWYFGPIKAEAGFKYLFTQTVRRIAK